MPDVRRTVVGLTLGVVTILVTSCASRDQSARNRIAVKPATASGSQFVPSSRPSSSADIASPTEDQITRVRTLLADLGVNRSAGFYLARDGTIVIQVTDQRAGAEVVSAHIPGVVPHRAARSLAQLRTAEAQVRQLGSIAGTSYGIDDSANRVVVEADGQVSDSEYDRLRHLASRSAGAISVHRIDGRITPD